MAGMQADSPDFDLAAARSQLELALEAAGFDVIRDPGEPNLVQARRDREGDTATLVVDAGGRMRYTRTRRGAPARRMRHKGAGGRRYAVTRTRDETIAVIYVLAPEDSGQFAPILAEFEQL
jgi:hypothetical protein